MHYNYRTSWAFWHPYAMGSRKYFKLGNDLPFKRSFYYRFNDNMSSSTTSDSVLKATFFPCTHSIKSTSYMGLYIDGDRGMIPYEADALIIQLSYSNRYGVLDRDKYI